jgi:hypothetical protein
MSRLRGALLLTLPLILTQAITLYPTELVYQYPQVGTWLENIAVRKNGSLLLTSI